MGVLLVTGTGTPADPIIAMSADLWQIARDVRASLFHFNRTDDAYWLEKESTPAQFSNGLWHLGHNRYWEARMDPTNTGSANPEWGRQGALFVAPVPGPVTLPDPPSAPPDETAAGVLKLVLARLEAIEARLAVIEQRPTTYAPLPQFPIYEGKVKIPYLGTGTVTLTPIGPTVAIIGRAKR